MHPAPDAYPFRAEPIPQPKTDGVPASLLASIADIDRVFPKTVQPDSYASFVGTASGVAATYLRRAADRARQFDSVMLDHFSFRRALRQPMEAMPKLALRHLNALLEDYDALAPMMAELRARRDAAVAPMAEAA